MSAPPPEADIAAAVSVVRCGPEATQDCYSHTALGSGDRGNDLLRTNNGTRVVWDIDIEGDVHHLV